MRDNLSRRAFIGAASALALASSFPKPALAGRVRVIRAGTNQVSSSQLAFALSCLNEEVAQRTGGRYRVELYANSELGEEMAMLAAVRRGSMHVALLGDTSLGQVVPEFGVFSVPFLFRGSDHARGVADGPIGMEILAKLEAAGVVALGWAETGLRHFTSNRGPIRTPADMKGLKMRAQQSDLQIAAFKLLGADPAPLPFGELYGALEAGRFEAQENPLGTVLASNFYKVQKFCSLTGHIYAPTVFATSSAFFATVDPEDQLLLRDAAKAAGKRQRDYVTKLDAEVGEKLSQNGMTLNTDVDRKAFEEALKPMEGEFARLFGAERLAAIRSAS